MGRYGNIDGIATLTNNPNALDNVRGSIGYIYLKNQKRTINTSEKLQRSDRELGME